MNSRRLLALGGLGLCMALITAGCVVVLPSPNQGDPVPDLVLSLSQPEPLSGLVTVTATPVNFAPTSVQFRRQGDMNFQNDDVAPFEAVFDTASLPDGPRLFAAIGTDGVHTVARLESYETRNDPNYVVVYVDDLDATASPYWDALPQTKALVADQGVTFSESFVTDPVCCPARATTLTGRYAHGTGVFDNTAPDGGYQAFVGAAENDTVATRLQAHSYSTAFLGKYLNGYAGQTTVVPPGWTEWFAFNDNGFYDGYDYNVNHNGVLEHYGSDPADYQTTVLTSEALDYIDSTETQDGQPFLLFISASAPHVSIPAAPEHQPNVFDDDPVPTRPNFDEADVSDKPTWLRDGIDPLDSDDLSFNLDDYRKRMGALLSVDDMVASLISRLATNGELADTVFVFTSDNGYNLGSHRLLAKQVPYEESVRVPLAISGPGFGVATRDELVTNIDLAPTLLDLAGLDPTDLDGRSLTPLLEGTSPQWRTDFLVEHHGTYFPYYYNLDTLAQVQSAIAAGVPILVPTYRALRTEEWLYVEWYSGTAHEYELYDMASDPYQLDNLVATPQGAQTHATTTAELQARLDTLSACAGATCRT